MRHTGIDLLAADLGTTPERLALWIVVGLLAIVIGIIGFACIKLGDTPEPEGFPDDPRPPRPGPGVAAAEGPEGRMTIRRTLTVEDRAAFPVGQAVRYLPGFGTYGYEDCLEDDGKLPGVVLGHTATRVQVELTLTKRGGAKVRRTVNADQLSRAA